VAKPFPLLFPNKKRVVAGKRIHRQPSTRHRVSNDAQEHQPRKFRLFTWKVILYFSFCFVDFGIYFLEGRSKVFVQLGSRGKLSNDTNVEMSWRSNVKRNCLSLFFRAVGGKWREQGNEGGQRSDASFLAGTKRKG